MVQSSQKRICRGYILNNRTHKLSWTTLRNFFVKYAHTLVGQWLKDEFLQFLELKCHVRAQEMAQALNINCITVWNLLKWSHYTKTFNLWVPHDFMERNSINWVKVEALWKRICTEEKWKNENKKRTSIYTLWLHIWLQSLLFVEIK